MVANAPPVDMIQYNLSKTYRRLGLPFTDDRIAYHCREFGVEKVKQSLEIFEKKDPKEIIKTSEKYFEGVLKNITLPKESDLDKDLRETQEYLKRQREIESEISKQKRTTQYQEEANKFFNLANELSDQPEKEIIKKSGVT